MDKRVEGCQRRFGIALTLVTDLKRLFFHFYPVGARPTMFGKRVSLYGRSLHKSMLIG